MSENPKVSVILTSYNHAKYLHKAIDSALAQTFSDFELIIWDDASTDLSWEIINSYSDPRIRSFRNQNNQRSGNIRQAIEQAVQGEYIAVHHSDDIWEPQKLEKQIIYLDSHPEIGAVFSWAQIIDENGQPFTDETHFYYNIFEQPNRTRFEWLNYFFYQGNALCHPSVLIRKECYDACGLYRYGLAQFADFDMWVRLCMKYEIHVLPEKLVQFRVLNNEANISGSRPDVRTRLQFEYFQIYQNYCAIPTAEEFIKIFPSAEKYLQQEDFDLGFALGMTALETGPINPAKLFGLNLLFKALNDPEKKKKINRLYGFTNLDFFAFTAKDDVFSVELLARLRSQVETVTARVEALTSQVEELTLKENFLAEILNSRAWKYVTIMRRIRSWLFH